MKTCYVYMLTNERRGDLYVGMTNNVANRLRFHKEGTTPSYVREHGTFLLMRVEVFPTPMQAIKREKKLKKWRRRWKIELIEKDNPTWTDLSGNYQ